MDTEEIEFILNCPICMDEYNDPRILPCQHSFCEQCLSTYIKDLSKTKPLKVGSFPCPICRHKTKLRNNVEDASSFEKDLTKIALLKSKDILLMQDEESTDESDECAKQTMNTQTDDHVENKDITIIPASDTNCEARKLPLKKIRKRVAGKNTGGKEKRPNRIIMKKGLKQNIKKDKETKITESDDKETWNLEATDYCVTCFIVMPLLCWRSTGFTKQFYMAILLFVITIIVTIGLIRKAQVPYAYLLFAVIWLVFSYKENSEILSSHCRFKVKQYQKLMFGCLRLSFFIFVLCFFWYVLMFLVSSGTTITNALWTNHSVVSFQEFENNFYVYQSKLEITLHNVNVYAYIFFRGILHFLSFLIWK